MRTTQQYSMRASHKEKVVQSQEKSKLFQIKHNPPMFSLKSSIIVPSKKPVFTSTKVNFHMASPIHLTKKKVEEPEIIRKISLFNLSLYPSLIPPYIKLFYQLLIDHILTISM
jgi:hypothetical protein